MPTAAVSQALDVPQDVEAGLATTSSGGGQGQQDASAPPVEIEAEEEEEEEESTRHSSATWTCIHSRRQLADFPFFALGFAAVVRVLSVDDGGSWLSRE